jgi:catechol 2,3-dioxygenase-like lactoylglutathione lyase family enzyme
MSTIFDSLVKRENDHTNLLRNVMGLHPRVASCALTYLLDRDVSDTAPLDFRTQYSFWGPDGLAVPDLLVEGTGFRCLIEVKIDPELGLSDQQQKGYKACFKSLGDQHLCFLVPEDWKHSKSTEPILEALKDDGISVHLHNWRGLITRLDEMSETISNPILTEAINFWKWRFEVQAMSSTEKDFLNAWSGEQYSAFRKIEKLIDQTKKLFDARDYETESETSFTESYGFYVKRGRQYLLWVGIWTESPTPLAYGFHPTGVAWRRPSPIPTSPISTKDGYKLWPLGPETWGAAERIYSSVTSFLESQRYD